MREAIQGAGGTETAEVRPTKAPYRGNKRAGSRQQTSPALQSSSSGLLSLTRGRADEELVEQKLSEKLMDGFLLLEKACPCCATPLVKQEESADLLLLQQASATTETETKSQKSDSMSSTLQGTVTPIAGIPFCVTCQAHIVTNEVEAVALQERYAGKTVQGKIMVAVSNGGSPSPLPTNYSGWSLRSQASKKSFRSISLKGKNANNNSTHCGSTVLTDMRDEVSTLQSVQSKPIGGHELTAQMSPALLTMKDTVEMFRSESSMLCPKQSSSGVPDKLTSPLSCRPSISNLSSPHVAAAADKKRPEKQPAPKRRATRLARRQAFAIAHGGGDEIEIICAESTQWFSLEQDDNDDDADVEEEKKKDVVETTVREDGTEPKQGEEKVTTSNEPTQEEEMTMRDEDDEEDEDSLRVMTSQDGGPFETEAVNVPALKTKTTEESIGHRSKQSTSSHRNKQCNTSDRSNKQSLSVQKVCEMEPSKEYEEEQSSEKKAKLELGKEQPKEVVESIVHQASANITSSESREKTPEITVANESSKFKDLQESEKHTNDSAKEEVIAEPAIEANDDVPVNVVDDHDDIHEISVDHEDLMVGSCEDLTTEGSHLADQEHDDEIWPSYEERKAVATKVLGVKIMQGYSLLEKQCPHCTMPLTEYKGSIDCFVCPALEKKVAKAQQQRRILESEMSRVKLETQLMEQRKMVQANKNKLLEKSKKLGKPSSISSSSVVSAKHFSNLCDPKIKEDRAAEHARTKPNSPSSQLVQEKKTINESNISGNKDVTEMHSTPANAGDLQVVTSISNITSKASNSTPIAHGNDNLKDASDGDNLRVITSQSNITLKATNSTPVGEGNNNVKSPVTGDGTKATPTSLIQSKTEESNQSKTIVKAVNTMSTSDASSKASNQSKLVVKAQSVLSTTTAASSVASHRSKVVVKANSLLSAATVASTQASSRSNVILIDSLLNKTTMPCSPASAKSSPASAANSKTIVKASSLAGVSTAVAPNALKFPATVVKASSLAGVSTAVATNALESPASAKNKIVVKASSPVGVPTAASTKESGSDQATANDTDSACINGVIEKANETETKSSSVEIPALVKSEESMPVVSSEISKSLSQVIEPRTKESGVSSSEKKSRCLSLGHSASTQLAELTKDSTFAASPEGGTSLGSSKEQGASEGSQSHPRERGLPIRPVMALVKVTPQPAPAQRKKNKNAITKFAVSTKTTTPQVSRPEESGQPEQKLPSMPHPSEESSKISSAHSDSTISTKSKIPRSDRHVAVVEHHKEAEGEAEAKMQEKVNLAIGPTDIRSFPSDDSSEKNLSIATPANPGNCISAMFSAAIGTISADDDSIMPPTQHELHKLNLEEIRHLKEAIQAEKAMQENGIEKTSAAITEAKQCHRKVESQENVEDDKSKSAAKNERAAAKEETMKIAVNRAESAKACPKRSEEEAHIKPEDTHEVVVGPGQEKKPDEVEQEAYAFTKQVENAPEAKRKMEKSVEGAPEMTEDEKSPKSNKKEESAEQSLAEKIGALAKAIAEADKTAIAEAESIVRSSAEDYHDDQSRSSSLEEIRRQQWETLRSEGRAAMTRRSMTGWTVSSEFCRGKECGSSPLVVKGSTKQCVVCGGTGTGLDGVYDLSEESETSKKENFASNETISVAPVIRPPRFDFNTSIKHQVVKPPPSSPVNLAIETDAETESKSSLLIRPPRISGIIPPYSDSEEGIPVTKLVKPPPSSPLNLAIETDTETESKSLLIRPPRISGIIPPDSDSEEGIPVTKLASLHLVKSPRRFTGGPTEVRMVAMTGQPDFTVLDGKEARDNIESKRTIVSKEIGKRMLQGWKLLNLTCPTCLMPLMIDENDEHEICVLCGLVTEGLHSTGTESTMQPTLSFKSTEDNESSLTSPVNFTALVPMNHSETGQNERIDAVPGDSLSGLDSTQKPDEDVAEIRHKESHNSHQRSHRKSVAESSRKSSNESSLKSSKKHKKSSRRSKDKTINEITVSQEGGSPRKSKKSTRKSSKEEIDYSTLEPGQDLPSIGHLSERIKHRVNTPRSDPPAARGHNVVRKSMLEADAMKAGEVVEELFDVEDTSPVAADDKACGPSPSMIKTFDCDPPKENLASAGVATPFPAHKACDPSPSMKKILHYVESRKTQLEKKPDASADYERVEPPIHTRSPSIDPESSMGEYSEQPCTELINYCESPDYEEILTLEIPKGFDVNDEAALRQLIAQAKVCRPAKHDTHETQAKILNQDTRRGCHLPSPGLTDSPPGSLRVDIDTMMEQHHTLPAMEGRYHHLQSPGMSTASLPLKSPASYRPPRSTTSAAPEPLLVVHTSRSQLRPRITPESMDRARPSSRSRASSRSGLYSVGEDASDSSSFDYVHVYSSHSQSQSRTSSRIPLASPGASSSSYRVEKKSPESPEVIVIGGPDITLMDDLVSLGLKSIAARSIADSISTAALDALLARIEQTKYELDAAGDEQDGVEKHEKIAGLLQELSSAAAQMEMLDDPSSTSSAASCSSSSRGFRQSSS